MDYFLICLAAFLMSALSLYSGFGLGTVLLPVFALFFPLSVAMSLTAIVHFFNNVLKLLVLGKYADWNIVRNFGLPAILAAGLGAQTFVWLSGLSPLGHYQLGRQVFEIMPVKLLVAFLIVVFVLIEATPGFGRNSFEKKFLPLGGLMSGFLGGLSGHQGALRSAFLLNCGLSKESFIASGVVIACLVDLIRLLFYNLNFSVLQDRSTLGLLGAAIFAACLGVFVGNLVLIKVSMKLVRQFVALMLCFLAILLAAGWV